MNIISSVVFSSANNSSIIAMPRAEGRFQCAVCKKTLKGLYSFQYHAKNIHSNTPKRADPDFRCLVCKAKFSSLNVLQGHILKSHSPNNGQGGNSIQKIDLRIDCFRFPSLTIIAKMGSLAM